MTSASSTARWDPSIAFDTMTRLVGLGGPRPGESERDRVLNALFKQLEVYSAKESRFIGVRMTSIDPELAAEIANRVAETYRNSLASAATQEVDDQQKVLQGKIDKLIAGSRGHRNRGRALSRRDQRVQGRRPEHRPE